MLKYTIDQQLIISCRIIIIYTIHNSVEIISFTLSSFCTIVP